MAIGGGDTSLDCARTALRLTEGKGKVTVLCLQPETGLHVDPIMLEEAKEEGMMFRFLGQTKSFKGDGNGHVVAAVVNKMQMGTADQSGKSHPQAIPDQEFIIPCSTVLIAIGRGPNSFLQKRQVLRLVNVMRFPSRRITKLLLMVSLPQAMLRVAKR